MHLLPPCREECREEGPLFYFTAPCGSTVSLYFVDNQFVPNNGTAPLEVAGACASQLPSHKLCKTCGPFEFPVVRAQLTIWFAQCSSPDCSCTDCCTLRCKLSHFA